VPSQAPAADRRTLPVLPIDGRVQEYAWGSPTVIPRLLGTAPDGSPKAELWLGTHPAAPATVAGDGAVPVDTVTGPLPFLLKILAAEKALSLQAHPTPEQAADGFARDEAAGIPVDAPHRRYRDRAHKPELIVALTPFRALAGIRPAEQTLAVIDALAVPELSAAFAPLREDPGAAGAASVLGALLRLPPDRAAVLVAATLAAVPRLAGADPGGDGPLGRAATLLPQLADAHPGDIGIPTALLLNDVTLRPGEALYQPAGMLHAYVRGAGVEIMACSDNVLRGGLTTKHIDVDELLGVLDTTPIVAPVMQPEVTAGPGGERRTWAVPVPDFALAEVRCDGTAPVDVPVTAPAILLTLDGEVTVTAEGQALPLPRGSAALVVRGPVSLAGTGTVVVASAGS
jgi:mannose-6-phosphate isomerase